jgi:hypothetical protein
VEELVHPLWLQQISEAVLAEIAEFGPGRKGVAGEELNRRGEQDLPTVTGPQQPSKAVERSGEVVASLVWRRFPGVQRHPHPERTDLAPILYKECPLSIESGRNGLRGRRKGGLHRIPDGLEVGPPMRLDRGIEQGNVTLDCSCHRLPVPLPERSAALDVGEEEGDGAAGEIGHDWTRGHCGRIGLFRIVA